jgi:hypothetical protein
LSPYSKSRGSDKKTHSGKASIPAPIIVHPLLSPLRPLLLRVEKGAPTRLLGSWPRAPRHRVASPTGHRFRPRTLRFPSPLAGATHRRRTWLWSSICTATGAPPRSPPRPWASSSAEWRWRMGGALPPRAPHHASAGAQARPRLGRSCARPTAMGDLPQRREVELPPHYRLCAWPEVGSLRAGRWSSRRAVAFARGWRWAPFALVGGAPAASSPSRAAGGGAPSARGRRWSSLRVVASARGRRWSSLRASSSPLDPLGRGVVDPGLGRRRERKGEK